MTERFDLADLTPLAPEALWTAALVVLGGVSQAGATVTTCGGAAGGRGAMQKTCDLIHHSNLIGWTPGVREWTLRHRMKLLTVGNRVGESVYLHSCFLHRSTQYSGLRQGLALQASEWQPGTTPRRSSTVLNSVP